MADADDFDWGEAVARPVQAAQHRPRPRAAQYSTVCSGCSEWIREGDTILMTDDGAIHEECDPTMTHPDEPKVCTTCWLTHPEGACDR